MMPTNVYGPFLRLMAIGMVHFSVPFSAQGAFFAFFVRGNVVHLSARCLRFTFPTLISNE
jgi:hypothetical protein